MEAMVEWLGETFDLLNVGGGMVVTAALRLGIVAFGLYLAFQLFRQFVRKPKESVIWVLETLGAFLAAFAVFGVFVIILTWLPKSTLAVIAVVFGALFVLSFFVAPMLLTAWLAMLSVFDRFRTVKRTKKHGLAEGGGPGVLSYLLPAAIFVSALVTLFVLLG
jgi:hypothetical protein